MTNLLGRSARPALITLGLLAFALVALTAQSARTAQAASPRTVTIIKACDPGVTGTFLVSFDVDVTSTDSNVETKGDNNFDMVFPIGCGDSVVLDGNCPLLAEVTTEENALCPLIQFLTLNNHVVDTIGDPSLAVIDEVNATPSSRVGDCDINLNDRDTEIRFRDDGLVCTLTNDDSAVSVEEPVAGTIIFNKVCEGITTGSFTVNTDISFDPSVVSTFDPETEFDSSSSVDCDGSSVFDAHELLTWLACGLCHSEVEDTTATITETDAPPFVTTTFGDDCAPDGVLDLTDPNIEFGFDFTTLGEKLVETGLICTITNTAERPDLSISKLCPTGNGDATFNVNVSGPDLPSALNPIECGGDPVVVADLTPGTFTIDELISGTDAGNFATSITCTGPDGLTTTDGTTATVDLSFENGNVSCLIVNALTTGTVGDEGPIGDPSCSDGIDNDGDGLVDAADPDCQTTGAGAPIIIIPDITNILNNNNLNNNTSVNTNTNTLQQSNIQTQSNDNHQDTNVNANPVQNVNVGGAEVNVH